MTQQTVCVAVDMEAGCRVLPSAASRSVGELDDQLEGDILALLNSTGTPGLFSVSEICRGIGDPLAVTDAIDRLHKFGVIHRCGEFVLMTQAASRTLQLAEL